jgi:hypothetical protein
MAATQRKTLTITNLRGRDGSTTADIAIPHTRAKEMRNVDLFRTPFARKRNGCDDIFDETTSEAFTGVISALGRHVPGADETAAQLWAIDAAATPVVQYLAGGTAWATPTLKDNIATRPQDAVFVPFKGKLWIFYDSTQDRTHLYDGSTVRRVGLATPAAATVADTGSGSYAATLRYYKIIYVNTTDGRWSEASASVSFTPSGSGTHARITKPAAINEGESHWKIYASLDNTLYFLIATVAVGTTTYDDNTSYTSVANISGNDPIPVVGANTVPTSAKFGVVHDNKMLMGGSWESQNSSRIWFTPALGSSDYADDERIPSTVDFDNWVDVSEKDGDYLTGLGPAIQGMPIAYKNRHIYKLAPTHDPTAPYTVHQITDRVGSIRHHLIAMGTDENGNPAQYFWSHQGPYRLGVGGLQYLGKDVEDIHDTLNIDATTVVGFAIWHEDKHQVWFYLATGTSNTPDVVCVFHVKRGSPEKNPATGEVDIRNGWTTFDGGIAEARSGVMFAESFAASMPRTLLPYIGSTSGNGKLFRCDTGQVDNGTEFEAYVTLPEKHLAGFSDMLAVTKVIVLGTAGSHTLTLTMTRNYGCEPRSSVARLSAETGDQTRRQTTFQDASHADAKSIGMRLGDICPTAYPWQIDMIEIHYEVREEQDAA